MIGGPRCQRGFIWDIDPALYGEANSWRRIRNAYLAVGTHYKYINNIQTCLHFICLKGYGTHIPPGSVNMIPGVQVWQKMDSCLDAKSKVSKGVTQETMEKKMGVAQVVKQARWAEVA